MSYGLPYKGSKSGIVKDLVAALPSGERLVDLFCGGCAVTDYAMKKTCKYRDFLVNDLEEMLPATYLKALRGGFAGEDRWISREEFHTLKDDDPYVSLCFSFGNNRKTYMYGPDIEPYKEAIHSIVFWDDYGKMETLCPAVVETVHEFCDGKDRKGRRLGLGKAVAAHVKASGSVDYWQSNPMFRAVKIKWSEERRGMRGSDLVGQLRDAELFGPKSSIESLERIESMEFDRIRGLQSLVSLERIQSLRDDIRPLQSFESLERLERLQGIRQDAIITATSSDYREYVHEEGDVVYCDPPYASTDQYNAGDFDSVAFWEWARTRDYPVYVSEYSAPDDFVSIWSKEKRSLFNDKKNDVIKVEHLFVHRRFA